MVGETRLFRQDYFIEITDSDVRAKLFNENQRMIEDDVLPFGIIDDGQDIHEPIDYESPLGYSLPNHANIEDL